MNGYVKIALICAAILFLELWNFRQARRRGRIFLGGVSYDARAAGKSFKMAVVINIIWTVILLLLLLFCCLKAAGVLP